MDRPVRRLGWLRGFLAHRMFRGGAIPRPWSRRPGNRPAPPGHGAIPNEQLPPIHRFSYSDDFHSTQLAAFNGRSARVLRDDPTWTTLSRFPARSMVDPSAREIETTWGAEQSKSSPITPRNVSVWKFKMKISLNGPPDQATSHVARIPKPPDARRKALVIEGAAATACTMRDPSLRDQMEAANCGARQRFPSGNTEDRAEYVACDLRSLPLAPIIRPVAKTTLSMSFLF